MTQGLQLSTSRTRRVARALGWARPLALAALFLAALAVATGCTASALRTDGPLSPSSDTQPASSGAPTTEELPQIPAAAPPPAAQPAIDAVAARVTRVVDGDTVWVELPDGTSEKVRFIGVDTPESTTQVEPFGMEATAYTTKALSGKTVYLETDAELRDRYGRLLAHVWLDDPEAITDAEVRAHLFNAQLLLAGYANLMTIPPNVKYVEFLKDYEREARDASRGLWGEAPPVAPPGETPAQAPSAAYIANRNTGKFHYATCYWVTQMNPANKAPYPSREAAIADGYVPCKVCRP